MEELRRFYNYNSAICRLKDGKWNGTEFKEKVVDKIRPLLMDYDGVTDCGIYRYAVSVSFFDTIANDVDALDEHVKSVFAKAAKGDPDLFPYAKEKRVEPKLTFDPGRLV